MLGCTEIRKFKVIFLSDNVNRIIIYIKHFIYHSAKNFKYFL